MIAEVILPHGEKPEELYKQHVLGSPYGIHWRSLDIKPLRQLPLASKQSIRRKNLIRRMNHHIPLFAEIAIAEALENNPTYYGQPAALSFSKLAPFSSHSIESDVPNDSIS